MDFVHEFKDGLDLVSCRSIKVAIDRTGAELIGMEWLRPGRPAVPVIWRNMLREVPDDGFWRRHAPILFPIVGGLHSNRSVATTGEQVHFKGLHGFFRNSEVVLDRAGIVKDGFELLYSLRSDAKTMDMYPWKFEIHVRYVVRANGLEQEISVRNDDSRPMPFQLGWHPGINLPLVSGAKKDSRVRLPAGAVVRLFNDENCFLTGESAPFDTSADFRFSETELQATYMFDVSAVSPADRFVEIMDPDGVTGVRVAFPDYPHLGVWSDAGAPFICIEPWQGMDDSVEQEPFDRKFGIVMLAPGAIDERRASISLPA